MTARPHRAFIPLAQKSRNRVPMVGGGHFMYTGVHLLSNIPFDLTTRPGRFAAIWAMLNSYVKRRHLVCHAECRVSWCVCNGSQVASVGALVQQQTDLGRLHMQINCCGRQQCTRPLRANNVARERQPTIT